MLGEVGSFLLYKMPLGKIKERGGGIMQMPPYLLLFLHQGHSSNCHLWNSERSRMKNVGGRRGSWKSNEKPVLIINQFPLWETIFPAVLHGTDYAKNLAGSLLTFLS